MSKRLALFIGIQNFEDKLNFSQLKTPGNDAQDFAQTLRELGGFEKLGTLVDAGIREIREAIEGMYSQAERGDLTLLYYSGHGYRGRDRRLYLTARDTTIDRMLSTGLTETFIQSAMQNSRARHHVIILDSCFSGEFIAGSKQSKAEPLLFDQLSGEAAAVLASSGNVQLSFEEEGRNSLFTQFLLEGLQTGAADANRDGDITVGEMFDYADQKVREIRHDQTPMMELKARNAQILIAKSPIEEETSTIQLGEGAGGDYKELTGKTLGKYRLIERLGQGGMAEVFKAFQPGVERHVAIKVMHGHLAQTEEYLKRFHREAKAIGSLQHANIVRVIDFDIAKGVYYMVMEFVQGDTLKQFLDKKGALPFEQALAITEKLAGALGYAHRRGVIHRDIKPSNIMTSQPNFAHPILVDFGIAHMMSDASVTVTGELLGTPAYMSPEAIAGKKVDTRSDIYSLGTAFYEMLTGRAPYVADTPMGVILKKAQEAVPPPRELRPDIPQSIAQIALRAMAAEPTDRFQTAAEFEQALAEIRATMRQPLAAPPPPTARGEKTIIGGEDDILDGETILESLTGSGLGQTILYDDELPTEIHEEPIMAPPIAPPPTVPPQKRGIPGWMMAAGGVALILCLGLSALGLIRGFFGGDDGTPTAVTQATKPPTEIPTDAPPTPTVEEIEPTVTEPPVPPTDTPPPTQTPPPVAGIQRTAEKDGMSQRFVPATDFMMGALDNDLLAYNEEKPAHLVLLDPYWIDEFEVSAAQFARFLNEFDGGADNCNSNSCLATKNEEPTSRIFFSGGEFTVENGFGDHPATFVTWFGAASYCQWAGRRLPTEAEWELAARGEESLIYPWGDDFDPNALNYCDQSCDSDSRDSSIDDGFAQTAPVGSFSSGSSPFGALDMAGNVWEWVEDWFAADYYAASPANNPPGPAAGGGDGSKVLRGGAYGFVRQGNWRTTDRGRVAPDFTAPDIGFRCAESHP